MGYQILVTGASGFLGSAICAGLCREHHVTGLFRRQPDAKLLEAAPGVQWERGDVSDAASLDRVFSLCASAGRPINYVIHFAAFTGFGKRWTPQYDATNVTGTRNMIEAACKEEVKRILFAGSIAALDPLPLGEALTEKSRAGGHIAYARSKALGEELMRQNSDRIPGIVLRLGGVFTKWCELPPLFSLIQLWSRPVAGRMIPGKGLSGFPYIHRKDVVSIVKKIIHKNDILPRFETLFAAPPGTTCHKELFPAVRQACAPQFSTRPITVPPVLARTALHGKYLFNTLRGKKTYERAWMIDYVDRPLVVDTGYTARTLGWTPDKDLSILNQVPVLMAAFKNSRERWMIRNIRRNDQMYRFDPD